MAAGPAPASTNRPPTRYVSPVVEAKRNQPVSVATAANSGMAISGVSFTPKCCAASTTSRPVASALVFLNDFGP